MKYLFVISIIITSVSCKSPNKRIHQEESVFQRDLNAEFKDATKSPLTKHDLKKFKGLEFFPVNNTYKVKAKLMKAIDSATLSFPTTTDRVVTYKKYGKIFFTIQNKELTLDIFKPQFTKQGYENILFLPFLDKTNGKTSYEGGRYVEVFTTDEFDDGTIEIDFNKAYNPYCAYSDRYSCPIPPRDNYLDIEIKAGVKKYKK